LAQPAGLLSAVSVKGLRQKRKRPGQSPQAGFVSLRTKRPNLRKSSLLYQKIFTRPFHARVGTKFWSIAWMQRGFIKKDHSMGSQQNSGQGQQGSGQQGSGSSSGSSSSQENYSGQNSSNQKQGGQKSAKSSDQDNEKSSGSQSKDSKGSMSQGQGSQQGQQGQQR
jgi:hypothetical protein